MRKMIALLSAGLTLSAAVAGTSLPAAAEPPPWVSGGYNNGYNNPRYNNGWGNGARPNRGYYNGYPRGYRQNGWNNGGAAVAAGAAGLVAGALIGSAIANSQAPARAPVYGAPVYGAPGYAPTRYPAPYAGPPAGTTYYTGSGGRIETRTTTQGDAANAQASYAAACAARYRSYDRASGTYLGYDGLRHAC